MYLSRFEDDSTFNQDKDYYAWKGYDFDVINKLWMKIIFDKESIHQDQKAYILPKTVRSMLKN